MVDFSRISAEHTDINLKLEQWGYWIFPRPIGQVQPMFQMCKSMARQWEMPVLVVYGSYIDHMKMEKAVSKLPEKHRTLIRWAYVYPWVPVHRVTHHLAINRRAMGLMLVEARDMLLVLTR